MSRPALGPARLTGWTETEERSGMYWLPVRNQPTTMGARTGRSGKHAK